MKKTIVQINFDYRMPRAEYEALTEHAAPAIAQVDGLEWKIFLITDGGQAGGHYLFRDAAAAEAYLNGPIVGQLRSHPAIANVRVQHFEIQAPVTATTRGPVAVVASPLCG